MYTNYTVGADKDLFNPKKVSQHTRLLELNLPDEPDSPFMCQDCVSMSNPPINRGINTTINV